MLTEITDRNQSSHVRFNTGHFLLILPDGVLHLGKPPPGRTLRTPFVNDRERRTGAGPVEQDRPGNGKFPLCDIITIEPWEELIVLNDVTNQYNTLAGCNAMLSAHRLTGSLSLENLD